MMLVSGDNFLRKICKKDIHRFLKNFINDSVKPILITDWDGTMKDYCSQYATNLQPIYSALSMAKFSEVFL